LGRLLAEPVGPRASHNHFDSKCAHAGDIVAQPRSAGSEDPACTGTGSVAIEAQSTFLLPIQRRLAATGVSYQDLLDESRREAAERYLSESPLSIAELAYLLGYSEPSAFHRAFKRWFGRSPLAFRERLRNEQRSSSPQAV